ncbi:MAG TPA: 2-dehydropantoate 2-reductase, partial [Longimicrobiales bacterium]|nr:2-dehydropantoate 2-reductase [Longimicrobiales bacterium]
MRIAVVGAGGVGGYYAGELARAGHDVRLLARGPHLAAIEAGGLEVRTPEGSYRVRLRATDSAEALGAVDVALVAVKAYSLEEVADGVRRLALGGGTVVPLLNGVDAAERLAALGVPGERLLSGLTYISAARVAPGVVERRSPFRRVRVGQGAGPSSERARMLVAALEDAGVDAEVSGDIQLELWRKFVFLVALSTACGLARAEVGRVRAAPGGERLLGHLVAEVATLARARGVPFGPDEERRALTLLLELPRGMRPSFLLDLEAGGRTELDALTGAVARMAGQAGVA